MGYAGFSLEVFSSRFFPGVHRAETRTTDLGKTKAQDGSEGKASLISDFVQDISGSYVDEAGILALPSWPGLIRPSTRTPQPRRKRLN